MTTTTLYRPVGLAEFRLLEDRRAWPPRLEAQPFFYPVTNREYAQEIAEKWNTKDPVSSYIGIVIRFEVDSEYLSQFSPEVVGSSRHEEYWIPADMLSEFNEHLVGPFEVLDVYEGTAYIGDPIPTGPLNDRN